MTSRTGMAAGTRFTSTAPRDFSRAPFLVIWEVTQACDLACRHCRASAISERDPRELSTEEGMRLLNDIRGMGDPLMVFTGGDPLKRADLYLLLRHSARLGLRTTVTPSATDLLTAGAVRAFQETGVSRMAISIDGPDAAAHDGFRGVAGSFERSLEALAEARRTGLETQVNTTVTRHNLSRLEEIAALVGDVGARLWSVFFLIVTGRARLEDDLSAEGYEEVFARLHAISRSAPFDVKTTEAQHYRRFAAQRKKAGVPAGGRADGSVIRRQAGINDGKGFVFVSHNGEIFPSGFLPLTAGNVRRDSLAEVYRNAPLFRVLRDTSSLEGKCGACEYRNLCGGSRSRAYALTGNYLAEDPNCVYRPGAA